VILVALLENFILALYRRGRKTAACEGVLPAINDRNDPCTMRLARQWRHRGPLTVLSVFGSLH
jgi:hypothetical protein